MDGANRPKEVSQHLQGFSLVCFNWELGLHRRRFSIFASLSSSSSQAKDSEQSSSSPKANQRHHPSSPRVYSSNDKKR